MRAGGVLLLACTMLLGTAHALAATVVIVRPTNVSPAMAETAVRIRGELISAGFAVEIVDGTASDPRDSLEQLAEQRRADAALAIVGDAAPNSVEAWVVDRLTGKSVMRRLPFEPQSERAPQALAIRAIELLRSSFLEINLLPAERSEIPAAVERLVGVEVVPRRPESVAVEAGAAGILGGGGVGPVLVPVLLLDGNLRGSFFVQAALAGLGTRPRVRGKGGSAQVAQELGLVGLGYGFRPGMRWQPFLVLSAGALHTTVEGRADQEANRGASAQRWSLLMDAGLGCWLRVRERFTLALAAHLQMAEPYPSIRFLESEVATSGRPNIFLSLTAGAWL